VRFVETDLRLSTWPDALPGPCQEAVSATALHWLNQEQLGRLYGQLAKVLTPGGVFLNADHVGSSCPDIQQAWEGRRQQMTASACAQGEDWASFWAAYLKDWPGPSEGERPSAYIMMVGDYHIAKSFGTDMGIAAQSILLGAREQGLAGCMIGSINKELLQEMFHIPKRFEILLIIALGKPKETAVLAEAKPGDGIEYWRDEHGVHHVPKRPLDDIILSQ
jgi:hypothetical protein